MKNNIIYIRTSTSEQTPELQLRDIKTICPGGAIEYVEQLSAWKENVKRPVFEEIIKQIKDGTVEYLYVWDWDRIYRNRNRLKEFLILCKTHGVVLHSFRQKWFEDFHKIPPPFDDILMSILTNLLGWISEEESLKKSSRVKLAVKRTSTGTYSHNGNKWGRKPLPSAIIDQVLALHGQGKSIREIASSLEILDSVNLSRKISKSAVQKIINNKLQGCCP